MLAILKFRRLPYRLLHMGHIEEHGSADPPVHPAAQKLLPKIVWPDGTASNDSTFLVRELEERSLVRLCFVFTLNIDLIKPRTDHPNYCNRQLHVCICIGAVQAPEVCTQPIRVFDSFPTWWRTGLMNGVCSVGHNCFS